MPAPAGEGIPQVIPTLEDIIRMLLAGECSHEQARLWLSQHENGESERYKDDRKFIATLAMQGILSAGVETHRANCTAHDMHAWVSREAVAHADALLKALAQA